MKIHYVDAELISIKFSSLIINGASLNREKTIIYEFVQNHNIDCKTNGKLIVMYEMNSHHPTLSEFAKSHLHPLGLKDRKDYLFIEEQLHLGVEGKSNKSHLGREMPETIGIQWLSSKMTKDGCFVYKASTIGRSNSYLQYLHREELLELWNREVRNNGWTSSRGVFLTDLQQALKGKGIDTTGLGFKDYRRLENNELVVCKDPRQIFRIKFPNGKFEVLPHVHKIDIRNLNLRILNTAKYIQCPLEKSHLFQLNNSDKCIEVLVVNEKQVISSTILIGHKDKDFGQFIFGKEFLVIPRFVKTNRIPEKSIVEKVIKAFDEL